MARLTIVLTLLVACTTSIRTEVEVDPEADFSVYDSYAWIPMATGTGSEVHGGYVTPEEQQLLVRVVDEVLVTKGYTKAASADDSDLALAFAVGREEKTEVRTLPGSRTYTYDSGFSRAGYGTGGATQEIVSYEEGMLVLEFYESGTRHAVWIGQGSKRLTRGGATEEGLRSAVETILASFPPRR
jgi:hypothetical protein